LQEKKYVACIKLYTSLNLFVNAVDCALLNNLIELAKDSVREIKDSILKKELLLKIINFLIFKEPESEDKKIADLETMTNRRHAIKILVDFNEDLQIDDVLKLLPDNYNLDAFINELKFCLEKCKEDSEYLKNEIKLSVNDSDSIRSQKNTKVKKFDISENDLCSKCNSQVLSPTTDNNNRPDSFYIFPCGHCFHLSCLIKLNLKLLRSMEYIAGEETVFDLVFNSFKVKDSWRSIDLHEITSKIKNKSENYLRNNILSDICIFDKFTNTYRLKENIQLSKRSKIINKIDKILIAKRILRDTKESLFENPNDKKLLEKKNW